MKELIYGQYLLERTEWYADKVGFIDGAYRGTYAQHMDRVLRLCGALRELGVQKTDRIAVMALNSHSFLEVYHAAYLGAGVINPLNLRLAPAELEYILHDSGTKVCFVDPFFSGVIDQVRKAAGIQTVVLMGEGKMPPEIKFDLRMEELIGGAAPQLPPEPEENDPVVLMYTGGTTGLPKGVYLEQRAEMLNLMHAMAVWRFSEDQVFLHQTPMFHAASMTGLLGMPLGGTSVFTPVFNAGEVMKAIEQHKVTMTVMVPTMISMVLDHPEFKAERLASLQTLTYGASPMQLALLEKVQRLFPGLRLFQGYGMTESAALVSALSPEDHARGGDILKSAGRALPGIRISIQDENGRHLAAGETGEVCVRGGNFMREYWKKPEETTEAFKGGWYHTGDAGYLDAQGYLYLVDRVKDMIVTGGENVYTSEVENALAKHPAVAQVAVIGIPDDKWGEAVHAVVVPYPGASVTPDELIAHARGLIAGYKVPKSIELRASPLPLSGAMKVLKRELRAPFWQGRDRNVG
jgi:long-chain acyl-CoA synthetase